MNFSSPISFYNCVKKYKNEFQNDSHNYLCPFCPEGLRCTTWWQGEHARTFDTVQRTIAAANDFITQKASFDPTKKIWTICLSRFENFN